MGISTAPGAMTSEEIVALNRAHTFFSWSAQGAVDPIAIDRAEGVWLYTPDGTRILDFNSQLMSVNIGHGDRRVIDAITEQATKLQYVQPAFATEIRGRLGQKLAEILPGDIDKVFFTLGGARGDRERDQARPPLHRPLQGARPLPGIPRRHARRDDADRRPAPLGERAGPRRRGPLSRTRTAGARRSRARSRRACRASRTSSATRVRRPSRPCSSRPSSAPTASSSRPTATSQGVRELCDRHGILMVCRRGHGRLRADRPLVRGRPLGRRARPDDDGQGPDLVVPAARRASPCATTSPRRSTTGCSTAA